MKIAVLSFTSGKVYRGVETTVHELCQRWAENHEVKVWQIGKNEDWDNEYDIRLTRSDCRKGFYYLTKEVVTELNQWKPNIVMPMNRGWQAVLTRFFCWKTGAKMIVSCQAGYKDRQSLLVRPDVLVALTERNAKWLRKYAFGIKVETIPNGVDLKKFTPEGKGLRITLEKPIILCVAGGERYKRVEESIGAVSILKTGSLLLLGGNKEQEILGKKILGKRFLRAKFIYEEMPKAYRTADVFTLVSEDSEAFGISYLEALASGLPVVAPDDELRREILGKYGNYVADVTNAKEYSMQLTRAVKQNKYRPEKWLAQFNWDKIAKDYEELFLCNIK